MVHAWDSALKPFNQDEEEETEKAVKAKMVQKPELPTQKEIEEHMITHTPFRNWCPHCVAGQGSCGYHKTHKDQGSENAVPKVHLDYMFMKSKKDDEEDQ